MSYIALNLPMRGYIESTKFTAVPEGFTQGCLNVLPRDVANSRMRIASRNALVSYSTPKPKKSGGSVYINVDIPVVAEANTANLPPYWTPCLYYKSYII